MGVLFFQFCLCSIILQSGVYAANHPPRFINDMNGLTLREDITVGTSVYKLTARDDDGDSIKYGIEADMFEVRDPLSGDVYLTQKLDYESMVQPFKVKVWAKDEELTETRESAITVIDVNDELPQFDRSTYHTSIRETAAIGTTVWPNLQVTDDDSSNPQLSITCLPPPSSQSVNPCLVFGLSQKEGSSSKWRGDLILYGRLNYEKQSTYNVYIRAFDGVHNITKKIQVDILDVQDKPPRFTNAPRATISENVPQGTPVVQMTAVDGDAGSPRKIVYELVSNPGDLFRIDRSTGQISTNREIDRESELLSSSIISLTVKASEVVSGSTVGTDQTSFSVIQVNITIQDENDNAPEFNHDKYQVTIPEDVRDRTPLSTPIIEVTDRDQGDNADFVLILANHDDVFGVQPTEGSESLTANIYVKNSSLIDFDTEPRKYVLHLIARETKTKEKRSNHAYVTIDLTDVNDNKPVFAQSSYVANVSETATGGTPVILITATDKDSGMFGPASLFYKLIGNGAEKFRVNQLTGQVTVAPCSRPGSRSCIDYEEQRVYKLTFVVGDQSGEGFIVNVPLTIHILDENDNSPRLALPAYFRYIKEGETIPSPNLQIQATDEDSPRNGNNVITYSIVGGNVDDLWQIGPRSGVITARSPVDYEATPGKRGYYLLTVQAADPKHQVTCQVNISVIDVNDHSPVFIPDGRYEQTISEETPPGTVVETVRAIDDDAPSSLNGKVKYRITTGAQDKFALNATTGVITVAPDTTFDYDVQNLYEMTVLATDQGSPQKTATATVLVHIRDSNNKNPYFLPTTVTTEVYENATVGQFVIRMQATDPDSSASLVYYLEEPKQAWDARGQEVAPSTYEFRNLFNIERVTGVVRVNHTLNRDKVAVVSSTVKTVDTSGHGQSATATLIINILEVNDKAPEFRHPWTVDNPIIPLRVKEGKPLGSYVTTLVATDPTDAIDQYKIIYDPDGFFTINNVTGVVTVKKPLDYETSNETKLVVTVTDNGHPQLTSTATVSITVENINDETPRFQKPIYRVRLMENSPADSYVTVVMATDGDLEDYGVVRYSLNDPLNRFTIGPKSGIIRVAEGAVLDREKQVEITPDITITVGVRDSPNHPDESLYSSVPVVITLDDANDNIPRFGSRDYYKVIAPTVPIHTRIVQLTAEDLDINENAKLVFYKISGDPDGLFQVNPSTGAVTVARTLDSHPGIYNMTVGVRDSGSPSLHSEAVVHITVLEGNNAAPTWLFPNATYSTVRVLENMYLGLEVTQVSAVDKDEGDNGRVSYGFYYDNNFVSQTPEFSINQITGVITARRVFDREEKDSYVLQLVASDSGQPPFRSTQILTVIIIDVDDNDPQFPQYKNCCTIPYTMIVYEKTPIGYKLGEVKAKDKDVGKHALTIYTIVGGAPQGTFKVNSTTGVLYLNKALNYEVQRVYKLLIRASSLLRTAELSIPAYCLCQDPSLVSVIVTVLVNGTDPAFTYRQYNACIAVTAPLGSLVTVVEARDPNSRRGMNYSITSLQSVNSEAPDDTVEANATTFYIGPSNGTVYSNALMTRYKAHYFKTGLEATGLTGSSTASLWIWVTLSSQQVTLTFARPIDEVKRDMQQIIRLISEITNGGIVCVGDPRYHITEANIVNVDWTDLVIHVIDGNTKQVIPGAVLYPLLKENPGKLAAMNVQGITMLAYSEWDGFIISPVLAAVILVLILLLLLLLLLCCCCFCCAGWYRRDVYTQRIPLIANVSKMNPLYYLKQKFYENQELSMNIGDKADLEMTNLAFTGEDQTDGWKQAVGLDQLAKGGAKQTNMTVTQTNTHYQVTSQQGALANGNAMNAGDVPRIEADLLGSSSGQQRINHTQTNVYVDRTQGGSYEATFGGQPPSMSLSTVAPMTNDDIGMIRGRRAAAIGHTGPAPFGAILTRSEGNLAQRMYSSSSELNGPGFGGPRVIHTAPLRQGVQVYNVTQSYGDISPQGYEHSGWGDGASYQGEIHVGSLAMPRPPPAYQENVFTETYRY